MSLPPLTCESLSCHRPQWNRGGPSRVNAISAQFAAGTVTGFCGPDGCGKGLLLNILGLLEPADSGLIRVLGHAVPGLPGEEARQLRNETFGFLFDSPCLLPSFSLAENVAMPLFRICGGDARDARCRTMEVLDYCGIADQECTLAGRLDDDARQRAALARALVHSPSILIAISPRFGTTLLPLVRHAAKQTGLCVLWAGEKDELLPHADHVLEMHAGRFAETLPA